LEKKAGSISETMTTMSAQVVSWEKYRALLSVIQKRARKSARMTTATAISIPYGLWQQRRENEIADRGEVESKQAVTK
jgi:hypothetical protein